MVRVGDMGSMSRTQHCSKLLQYFYVSQDFIFLIVGIVGGACSDVKQDIIAVSRKGKRAELDKILGDPARHGRMNYKDTEPYMSAFL